MIVPRGLGANEFIELKFKPGSWEARGIPEQGVRVRSSWFEKAVAQGGGYSADDLIYGLMDWLDVTDDPEPAVATLKAMLDRHYPCDGQKSARVHFADEHGTVRVFHAGKVDYSTDLVAWQRADWVIAAAQPSEEIGRIVVGAPAPISLNVALRILFLSATAVEGDPFDSFKGALSMAEVAPAHDGETCTHAWREGLGWLVENGELSQTVDVDYPDNTIWLPVRQLAMQVAIAAGYVG
jgi:hypothetical protein